MRPLPEFGWVSVGMVAPVVAVLQADGHDPRAVLSAGGVTSEHLATPTHRITIQAATRIWQEALRQVPDPSFGIRAALLTERGDFDLLSCLGRSSRTLEEALRFAVRFGALLDETLAPSLRRRTDGYFFSLGRRSVQYLPAVAEYVLLRLILLGRSMLGTDGGPLEVHFAHQKPDKLDRHREAFRSTLRFDQTEVGLLFETSSLAAPIPSADPVLKGVLEAYAQKLLDAAGPRITMSQRVRDVLVELIPSGFPNRFDVARRLGISERTLARMLKAENTSYTSLVDELRIERAFRRLQEGRVAIAGIALELGFQDQSAFTKFFKRHAGVLPHAYRRQVGFGVVRS